ncbi:septin [Ordospora colligata]|uniref:Septin n=1 Tax=Ordospora colligata OC4 TaxID=1354746 RepID=A0A0B2UN30_9MICR|nr:septin [Ordospora colligata OC4]KHN70477.1 septin [Ordospora colligata OC4]TBU17227.1 septin [Ordospora colligata]TBU17477.1 septin [Ordospora colligata]TBU19657.1 septin [Ordospora colligata]
MGPKGIGVSNLPNVKYRNFCKAGIDFNIMTAGSCGLGKTSFINQMLGASILPSDPFVDSSSAICTSDALPAYQAPENGKCLHKNSILNIQVSKFFVMENGFQTRVTVTEVDGIGDSVNNHGCWEPVADLLQENFKDFMYQERRSVRSLIKDKRIHLCLYFLEPNPTHVRMADICTMKEISKMCNLVPVIAKSDLLNDAERAECHAIISGILSSEGIDTFCLDSKHDDNQKSQCPYFVISGNMGFEDGHNHKREYPWGIMDLDKTAWNDFYFLVNSLISKNLINLVRATEAFYDDYRAREIGKAVTSESEALEQDDIKLTKEIQKKIKEDERIIMELRSRLMEKKSTYEAKLLQMHINRIDKK